MGEELLISPPPLPAKTKNSAQQNLLKKAWAREVKGENQVIASPGPMFDLRMILAQAIAHRKKVRKIIHHTEKLHNRQPPHSLLQNKMVC